MGGEIFYIVRNVGRELLVNYHIESKGYIICTSYWKAVGDCNMWR